MHIRTQKDQVRDAVIRRIKAMTPDERAAESRSLCKHTLHHYPIPKGVCAYYPLATEVDIRPLLASYLEANVPVYLPSFKGFDFTFRRIRSLDELRTGELKIPEPLTSATETDLNTVDIVLLPGRAFCTKGKIRLGRGNGGYDRWIQKLPTKRPKLIGVCFECQLMPSIPTEPHDMPLDEIMTARKLYWSVTDNRK